MKKTFQILTIIIIVFLLTNCNRKPYYKFNQDAKDFFIFKKGSWWVYENETTHEQDCLYIEKADNNYKTFGSERMNYYIDVALPTFAGKDSVFYSHSYYVSSKNNHTGIEERIYYKNINLYLTMGFPAQNNERTILYTGDSITTEGYVKLNYNDSSIYYEYFRTKSKNDTIFYTELTKIWRERYKGMVKFYIKNDTSEITMNLVDNNVVQ